jgi:hypothetical protein
MLMDGQFESLQGELASILHITLNTVANKEHVKMERYTFKDQMQSVWEQNNTTVATTPSVPKIMVPTKKVWVLF